MPDECDHEDLDFGNGYNSPVTCEYCGIEMQYDGDGVNRDLDSWSPVTPPA